MRRGTLFIDIYPESTSKIKDRGIDIFNYLNKWVIKKKLKQEKIKLTQSALIRLIPGSSSGKSIGFQLVYYYKLEENNFNEFINEINLSAEKSLIIPQDFYYIVPPSSMEFAGDNLPEKFLNTKSGKILVNVSFYILKSVQTINYIQNDSRKYLKSSLTKEVNKSGIKLIADTFYLVKSSPSELNTRAIGAQYIYSYKSSQPSTLKLGVKSIYNSLEIKTKFDTGINTKESGKIWTDFFFGYLKPVNL